MQRLSSYVEGKCYFGSSFLGMIKKWPTHRLSETLKKKTLLCLKLNYLINETPDRL